MDATPTTPDDLLRLLIDQLRDYAVVLTDPAGTVVGWRGGAEHVFGYAAREIVGRPASVLFTPEDLARGADRHEMAVAAADGRAEDDRWHVRKDGTRIWAVGVLVPLRDPAGRTVGYGKVLRDRTDVKEQIDALANANRRKDAFLGTLAHELRNPLAPILNAVHVLRATAGEAAARPLDVIDRQVAAIRRLVDDALDAVRLGVGKLRLNRRPVGLNEAVGRAADDCRAAAAARRQALRVFPLPAETPLDADPDRLHQALANLITNAVKYTPDGGRIWVKATVEGDEAVVRVEDTGVGIGADALPRLFELFTQEEASLDRAAGGLGLGLPLVKAVVEGHGGTVQVRSEGPGKGSEFTVRLPLPRLTAGG
jgi:PAS domain S-box-containing protein